MRQLPGFSVLLVLVFSLAFPSNMAHGEDDTSDKLVERFFAEAPRKWEEYRAHSKSIQGKLKAQVKVTSAGMIDVSSWEDHIKQNKNAAVIVRNLTYTEEASTKKMKELKKEEALGQNLKYSFGLLKKNEDWLLEAVNLRPEKPVTQDRIPLSEVAFRDVSPHFFILGVPLWDLIKKPTNDRVSFVKGTVVERESRSLIRLEAEQKEKGRRGWYLFDPENFWCLLEYEFHAEKLDLLSVNREKCEIERSQNLPLVRRYTFHVQYKKAGKTTNLREGIYDFELRVVPDIPDLEFTMSAFGLPEPVGIVWPEPTRWWLWISLATGGALMAGIGLGLLRRRSQTPGSVNSSPVK